MPRNTAAALVVFLSLVLPESAILGDPPTLADGEFQVSTGDGQSSYPRIAMNASGDFVVLWLHQAGTSARPMVARRFSADGTALDEGVDVLGPTIDEITNPDVAMDAHGNFIAAWQRRPSFEDPRVYARIYGTDGTPASDEILVVSGTEPRVAMNDEQFVVAWTREDDGYLTGIGAQLFAADGTPLDAELQVNTYTTGSQSTPAVDMDDSGRFIVVWQGEGFVHGVRAGRVLGQRFSPSGDPLGGEFLISPDFGFDQGHPAVEMAADGRFVVAWQGRLDPGEQRVFARRYSSDATPLEEFIQVPSDIIPSPNMFNPDLAADADGNFALVWESFGSNGNDHSFGSIHLSRFTSEGMARGESFQVNTVTLNHQEEPAIAMDAVGNYTVVWENEGSDPMSIRGQRFLESCTDEDTLCMNASRFHLEVDWRDFQGNEGRGQVVSFRSDDSGLFWFFSASNWEMIVKILDGCKINGHYWVFAAATTNVEYTLRALDTRTGQERSYFNPLGNAASALTDTKAFATCDAAHATDHDRADGEATPAKVLVNAAGVPEPVRRLGEEILVKSVPSTPLIRPTVAEEPSGGFLILWQEGFERFGSGSTLRGRFFAADGEALGDDFPVDTGPGESWSPLLIQDPQTGGFLALWTAKSALDDRKTSIFGRRLAADGSALGEGFQVNNSTPFRQGYPSVTSTADGGFLVVWEADTSIRARYLAPNAEPLQEDFQVNTFDALSIGRPAVASAPGGTLVVWESGDSPGSDNFQGSILGRFLPSDGTGGEDFQVNTITYGHQKSPDVASLPGGEFLVVWENQAKIAAQRFSPSGEPLGKELRVDAEPGFCEEVPSVAAASDGDFVVTWQADCRGEEVRGRRIAADGLPVGGEFLVSTSPADGSPNPAMAVLAEAELVVVWDGYSSARPDSSIEAQRLELACTDNDTLCLEGDRFEVEVSWKDFEGEEGRGRVVPFVADDSGLLWFFQEDNWEMLVKVLDGCELTGHYWIFSATTTNVEYTLRVTDTWTGAQKSYHNPLGNAADALTDTMALASCP